MKYRPLHIEQLSVKRAELAEEARIIRQKELRWVERAKRARLKSLAKDNGLTLSDVQDHFDAIDYAKANRSKGFHPPPQTNLGIRLSDAEFELSPTFENIRHHRHTVVRPHARAAHLADGFLRRVPYRVMEKEGSSEPDWKLVRNNALGFRDRETTSRAELLEDLIAWIEEGGIENGAEKIGYASEFDKSESVPQDEESPGISVWVFIVTGLLAMGITVAFDPREGGLFRQLAAWAGFPS